MYYIEIQGSSSRLELSEFQKKVCKGKMFNTFSTRFSRYYEAAALRPQLMSSQLNSKASGSLRKNATGDRPQSISLVSPTENDLCWKGIRLFHRLLGVM